MKRALRAGFLAILLLPSIGCSTDEVFVRTASGQQANIGHFETFGVLLPDHEDLIDNQIKPETMQRLGDLAVEQMKGLGYRPIAAQEAQLIVALSPGVRESSGFYSMTSSSSKSDEKVIDSTIKEGVLTVSFVDVKAKTVVLQRVAQARVYPDVPDEILRNAIAAVFKGTPRSGQ
jgi:uncharacterized protein DUF4136